MNRKKYTLIISAATVLLAVGQASFAQLAKQKQQPPKPQPKTQPKPQQKKQPLNYSFDASQSQINVILTQEGLLGKRQPTNRISIKNFNGKIGLPQDETRVTVAVEAEVQSMTNVDEEMGDFERKEFHNVLHNTVFESSKFPVIKFVSVSVADVKKSGDKRSFTLNGDLMMHGVTKSVSFPVNATVSKQQLRASGEGTLKQSDFGMKPFEKGFGLIKIADEVKVNFVVVAQVM